MSSLSIDAGSDEDALGVAGAGVAAGCSTGAGAGRLCLPLACADAASAASVNTASATARAPETLRMVLSYQTFVSAGTLIRWKLANVCSWPAFSIDDSGRGDGRSRGLRRLRSRHQLHEH